jgi:hypothetical protein
VIVGSKKKAGVLASSLVAPASILKKATVPREPFFKERKSDTPMGHKRATKEASERVSAQSSSLLLGLGMAALLAHSALVSKTGALSGFGWALLASLAGCLASTILNWSALLQTLIPERETWKRATVAGLLVAAGLFVQGLALASPGWSPIHSIALAFIPWSRTMWRLVTGSEPLIDFQSRISALAMILAATLFLMPEVLEILRPGKSIAPQLHLLPGADGFSFALPRCLSLISALLFGGASSLQRAQDRSISSVTFWSIPTAVSAILLSLGGWLALQIMGDRTPVMGHFNANSTHRLVATTPAFLFGILLLAMRPRIHIKNSLRIGRDFNNWWQFLGLSAGCALSLLLLEETLLTGVDLCMFGAVLVGQFIGLRLRQNPVTFAPTLSVVPESNLASPQLSSLQKS